MCALDVRARAPSIALPSVPIGRAQPWAHVGGLRTAWAQQVSRTMGYFCASISREGTFRCHLGMSWKNCWMGPHILDRIARVPRVAVRCDRFTTCYDRRLPSKWGLLQANEAYVGPASLKPRRDAPQCRHHGQQRQCSEARKHLGVPEYPTS